MHKEIPGDNFLFDFETVVTDVVLLRVIGREERGFFGIIGMRDVEAEFGTFLCV